MSHTPSRWTNFANPKTATWRCTCQLFRSRGGSPIDSLVSCKHDADIVDTTNSSCTLSFWKARSPKCGQKSEM
eukprot:4502555-Pyramimonas_sp.AAC.2